MILSSNLFAQEVSQIQLRVMQTRKFLKPIGEVAAAIKLNGDDDGAQCSGSGAFMMSQYKIPGMKVDNTGVFNCRNKIANQGNPYQSRANQDIVSLFKAIGSAVNQQSGDIEVATSKFELSANAQNTETTVRMRLYDRSNEQIKVDAPYAKEFKKLADGLFVQAIELNPQEQQ
jgi:hypothetical protein